MNVGNYESIQPTLRMVAELDEGEDASAARRELDRVVEAEWSRIVLQELRDVHKRRAGREGDGTVGELMQHFKAKI